MITGGAGFIGSAVVRYIIQHTNWEVLNLDKLTYAANPSALKCVESSERYHFAQVDICDEPAVNKAFESFRPDAVMHLAAESHVDRSIAEPAVFIETNIIGTYTLLNVALQYWKALEIERAQHFKFHHVSTDEVFGDLRDGGYFDESSAYEPSSPYSASKASSDHLVRAWGKTYGLPILVTHCSNNYGPFQHAEKLIPTVIRYAIEGKSLPIYGDGNQIRDWLYVDDHARALCEMVKRGKVGETYTIGGDCEKKNIEVVRDICAVLDSEIENKPRGVHSFEELITHVKDRPGHDFRYAINAKKIRQDLNWSPQVSFESGILKTVKWYLNLRPIN